MNLTIKDLATDIAAGGTRFELARNRVQSFAQRMLIRSQGKVRLNTSPLIYGPEDSAVAILLSALADIGVDDRDLLSEASIRSYSEMNRCLAGITAGERWRLIVLIGRWPRGSLCYEASLVHGSEPAWKLPTACTSKPSLIVVDASQVLQPVLRRLEAN